MKRSFLYLLITFILSIPLVNQAQDNPEGESATPDSVQAPDLYAPGNVHLPEDKSIIDLILGYERKAMKLKEGEDGSPTYIFLDKDKEGKEVFSESKDGEYIIVEKYSFTSIIVMSLLFILSFMTIFIFIERFKAVSSASKEKDDHMKEIDLFIKQNDLYNAKISVGKWAEYSDIGKLIEKGIIQHADRGKDLKEIKPILETEGELLVGNLERRLSVLATISGVAPMLGFLGTVLGMVKVFQEMSAQESFKISNLSGGIMEAMITTVGGLIVGIIAYVAYNYLVSKVEKVVHNMEITSLKLVDSLDDLKHAPKKSASTPRPSNPQEGEQGDSTN